MNADALEKEILGLPPEERARLAELLLSSLDELPEAELLSQVTFAVPCIFWRWSSPLRIGIASQCRSARPKNSSISWLASICRLVVPTTPAATGSTGAPGGAG